MSVYDKCVSLILLEARTVITQRKMVTFWHLEDK